MGKNDLRRSKTVRFRGVRRRLAAEPLEDRRLLATVIWDGGGDGTSWSDAANWDTNQLPANGDDVIIDSTLDPTIEYAAGTLSLASLTSNEALHLAGGSLTITGTGQINADLTAGSASLIATGPMASIQATISTSLAQTTLRALDGATITIPATSYTEGNSTLEADGAGSVLDLSSLMTMYGGGFIRTVWVRAENGGVVDLSSLTAVTGGATRMVADGMDSRIDANSLTTFTDTNGNRRSEINVSNGGQFDAPNLTSTTAVWVELDATATMATAQITSMIDSEIVVSGTTRDFSGLTDITDTAITVNGGATIQIPNASSIHGSSFYVYGGATLSVPAATSFAGQSHTTTRWHAEGASSRLEFPALATLSGGSFISRHEIEAAAGGVVELGVLIDVSGGATELNADGVGSVVNLPVLASLVDTNGNVASLLIATGQGEVAAPLLTSLSAIDVTLNADGVISTSQWTLANAGSITVNSTAADLSGIVDFGNNRLTLNSGGTADLSNASNIDGASFHVNDGVLLSLPSATSYVGQSHSNTHFQATGVGSTLDLSNLTTVVGGSFISALAIEAIDGGLVDVGNVTGITGGATRMVADGGTVDLSTAAELTDTNGNVASLVRSENGGDVILHPASVVVTAVTITLTNNGSIHAGTVEIAASSVLNGTGTLQASLVNNGIVRPGSSPGVQMIQGNYTQLPGGTLEVEIGGLVAQTEHDQLIVTGSATLDGILDITLINGFDPRELDAFELIDHHSSNGTFAALAGADLASGLVLDPQYGASAFRLNAFPEVSLANATIVEGDAGVQQLVFDVALTTDVGYDLQFDFRSSDDFATAGSDYVAVDDTHVMLAGATTSTIAVDILGDLALERDEWFGLSLLNPIQVALGDVVATGTILNDDAIPALEVADVAGFEPRTGPGQMTFQIGLSAPAPDPVDFSFATADLTAIAGADYTAVSGSAMIPASATRGLVSDGSDGEFHPTSNVTIDLPADGVLNYSSIHIPAGVTVKFNRNLANTPAILLSQNEIVIEGTINISSVGRIGGPGGGDGGLTANAANGTDGEGISPGTAGGYMPDFVGSPGGGGGLATAGLDPTNRVGPLPGSGGPAVLFPEALNDRGGSGGGGGGGWFKFVALPGGDGGGGGGGLVASSSHGAIVVDGSIIANGSQGGTGFANAFGYGGSGGGGSGGLIDLQADVIEINGTLQALGGEGGGISTLQPSNPDFSSGAHGGNGFIRLTTDDLTLGGTIDGELITRDLNVTIEVPIDILPDAMCERPESMRLQLSSANGALLTDPFAVGRITDQSRRCPLAGVAGEKEVFPVDAPTRGDVRPRWVTERSPAATLDPSRQALEAPMPIQLVSIAASKDRHKNTRQDECRQDAESSLWASLIDDFFSQR